MQSNTNSLREQIDRYLNHGDKAAIAVELNKHRNTVSAALRELNPLNPIVKLAIKKALANKRIKERAQEQLQQKVDQLTAA